MQIMIRYDIQKNIFFPVWKNLPSNKLFKTPKSESVWLPPPDDFYARFEAADTKAPRLPSFGGVSIRQITLPRKTSKPTIKR